MTTGPGSSGRGGEFDEQTSAVSRDSGPGRPQGPQAKGGPSEMPWWQEIYRHSPQRPRGDDWDAGMPPSPPPPFRTPPPRQGPDWYRRPPVRHHQPLHQPVVPSLPHQPQPVPARRRRWTKRRVFIVAGIAVVALELGALALGLGVLGTFKTTELDVTNAEAGVTQVLVDPVNGYGAQSVSGVRCNGGRNPKIEKGHSFTCQAVVNGEQREVTAVIVDDDGTYEVDWPR